MQPKLAAVIDSLNALVGLQARHSLRACNHHACRADNRSNFWIIDTVRESTLNQTDAAAWPVRHRALSSELSLLGNTHLCRIGEECIQLRTLKIGVRCSERLATDA